jgi:hypothetical protein
VLQEIQNVLDLTESCRYLAASEAHGAIIDKLALLEDGSEVRKSVSKLLSDNTTIQTMLERAEMVKHSLHFVDTSDDWILGADMFGIQTHYRKCEDDENAIIVKIEGTMDDLPLFEQMAVIHEIDLFKEWAPFCTNSVLVDKVGKAELYG